MLNNILTKRIVNILERKSETRDDMMLLVKEIHSQELNDTNHNTKEYYDVLFESGLSSIKTIDRIWRKVQEERVDLRGSNWTARQIQAGKIRADLIDNKYQLRLF